MCFSVVEEGQTLACVLGFEHSLMSDKAVTLDYVSFLIALFIEALQPFDMSMYDMNITAPPFAP